MTTSSSARKIRSNSGSTSWVTTEIAKLVKIQEMEHIIAADMSFAYSEDELNEERDKLELAGTEIPAWLNDENATKQDIQYNGDLKDRF